MERIIYPAVLYTDNPDGIFVIAIHDISLASEGATPEEAFSKMKEYLEAFFDCAIKMEMEVAGPSSFAKIAKAKTKKENEIAIMIDFADEENKVIFRND